jgi:phospholipid/cholesterol/gamma-HCH transport system substrate-binding protein
MSKKAPSTAQLLVISGFALSCFGILLFLWITFGGPTPFKAKSYEVSIPFAEAAQLAQQSDVRISGVNVGKVKNIEREPGKLAIAKIEIDDKYAPLPRDSRAILRTKTLLAETYVELSSGSRDGPKLDDGSILPAANVAQSVQIDEIFRTFDSKTRAAFQEWMQNAAIAINGQGQALSAGIGELGTTFTEFDHLFRILDTQELAVHQLFSNGAVALDAFRGREGELADLIRNSHNVFRTTAARDRDLEALFQAFPTFEDESRLTLERLKEFSLDTDPLLRQLVPAAEELSPTLIAFGKLAPEAKGFFEGFGTVIDRSTKGFPALRKLFRDNFPPLLRAVDPFARNLNPILTGLDLYKHEITSAMANVTAATQAVTPSAKGQIHVLRALGPFTPESLSTYPNRLSNNRNNAYAQPLIYKSLASGLPSFDVRQCSAGLSATLDPKTAEDPAFQARVAPAEKPDKKVAGERETSQEAAEKFLELIKKYALAGGSSTAVPAPGCTLQPPFAPINGSGGPTSYQHTFEEGK